MGEPSQPADPQSAAAGERIYRDKYQADFERRYPGQVAAINLATGGALVRKHAAEAGGDAAMAWPGAAFHLVHIAPRDPFAPRFDNWVP